jgi:hypothetical protein
VESFGEGVIGRNVTTGLDRDHVPFYQTKPRKRFSQTSLIAESSRSRGCSLSIPVIRRTIMQIAAKVMGDVMRVLS